MRPVFHLVRTKNLRQSERLFYQRFLKYPFRRMTAERMDVTLVTVSRDAYVPKEIRDRSIVLGSDIGAVLRELV